MITRGQLVEIGRYCKPHGVKGEISASIDCDFEALEHLSCIISDVDAIFVPFFMEGLRQKSITTVLLTLDGIDSEQDASLLVNKEIYALKSEFEPLSKEMSPEEFPVNYFVGFQVYHHGEAIGTVVDVDASTANVLFKVARASGGGDLLLPAAPELINDVETEERKIHMSLPEDLFALN